MKHILVMAALVLSFAAVAAAQNGVKKGDDAIWAMEKQAWEAFGKGDSKFFEGFLTADAMLVGDSGIMNKADSLKGIGAKPCEFKSFSFANTKVTMLDSNTALLTYEAAQDGMCGTMQMPSKMYVSSIYVKKGGKWMAAFHQETPAMAMQ